MEYFYIIVLSIAIVFLILTLTFVGIMMQYQDKSTVFPPISNNCPDFWDVSIDGKSCTIPIDKNVGTLYDANNNLLITTDVKYSFPKKTPGLNTEKTIISFNDDLWSSQGKTSVCAHKAWATNYGILWDGVTNNNTC
jgi:hypothetical protein